MVDAFGPRHLADVHQSFDPGFELHKSAVTHHVDDLTVVLLIDFVLFLDVVPRIGLFLLQAKCDFLFFAIDIQDDAFDFLIECDHFGRMANAFPSHVGDMQQSIDTTQINERAELGNVLHDTLAELTDFEFGQQLLAILFPLLLNQRPAANHDVAPCFVDLEHFALHHSADVIANIRGTTDVDLAGRQKDIDSDIHQQTTLDLARHGPGHDLAFLDRLHHVLPGDDLFRFTLAERQHAAVIVNQANRILDVLDQDFDDLPRE